MLRDEREMKTVIEAAYDKEFDEVLSRLGLKGDLDSGCLHCGFCGNTIRAAEILGVYADRDHIRVCCLRPECASRLAEKSARPSGSA